MKIEIVEVEETRKGLLVRFKDVIVEGNRSGTQLNEMGIRAWRILRLHESSRAIYAPDPDYCDANDRALFIVGGQSIKSLKTRGLAQAQMDKYANVRLDVAEFRSILVDSRQDDDTYRKTVQRIRQAWDDGDSFEAVLLFRLNLPVHSRDCELLTAALKHEGASVSKVSEDPADTHFMCVRVRDKDPRALLESLKPKIRKALA